MADLTLMAVHAHPDDESLSTGGVLARYSAEGVRTVLVICTDGGCGDGPGGVKPGEDGHDREAVVAERRRELERSCEVLGVSALELLGYRDSGMMGWADNDADGSFWSTPVQEGADRLGELFRRYRPDVVVTYDPNGFYGHPDHIQANRITLAAAADAAAAGAGAAGADAQESGVPTKLYYTAVTRSEIRGLEARLRELGVEVPEAGGEEGEDAGPHEEWGTPDEEVTTKVDVAGFADRKYDSLKCHSSQADNAFFMKMGRKVFAEIMGTESFVRVQDRTGAAVPETDLFDGIR